MKPLFSAVYKFTVKPGHEERFRDAWRRLTEAIYARHGSLGSRLHRGQDGVWFAYAQWPSRQVWAEARTLPSADATAGAQMRECLDGPIDVVVGEACDDLLR